MKPRQSNSASPFVFVAQGATGGEIRYGECRIARIENLALTQFQFHPHRSSVLHETFPLPLFWRQYADHQDPERNAGSNGVLRLVALDSESLTLSASGTNAGSNLQSRMLLRVQRDPQSNGYRWRLTCELSVTTQPGWLVTPNPNQGEVEFCNFWPARVFDPENPQLKRFSCCAVDRGDRIDRIPHHHLETADKAMIPMRRGDRFLWLLEDENPVIQLLSHEPVYAGICAYMWDVHFGFKVCSDNQPVVLPVGTRFRAAVEIYGIDREEGESLLWRSQEETIKTVDSVFHAGIMEFDRPYSAYAAAERDSLWPWHRSADSQSDDAVLFGIEPSELDADRLELTLTHTEAAESVWIAPSLGPAFGGSFFRADKKQRFTARIKLESPDQTAWVALRLHCPGEGSVFDLSTYRLYRSKTIDGSRSGWQSVSVCTPEQCSAPDRMHIMLVFHGTGKARFAGLHFDSNVEPNSRSGE
ncbi:hypothetical protein JW992_03785 [candidate division KSB1 bacterium]|nr:hypothetical protein [candidate division KSB1 bacterium]